MTLDPSLASESYCYLTTTGRVTGKPHEIEIWFALSEQTIYMMNGDTEADAGRADWVRNLRNQPSVTLRVADQTFDGTARVVTDPEEDSLARRLLLQKYATLDQLLTTWGRVAMPVAIDIPPD